MKLRLWRQVSSNHSNGFTLVGLFADEASAGKASRRIRTLLKDIEIWCQVSSTDQSENEVVLRPELQISAEYHFTWPYNSPTDSGLDVRRFRNIVAIEAPADSWVRRRPYEKLLRRLGGDTAGRDGADQIDDLPPAFFQAELSGTAPDDASAERFVWRWESQLGGDARLRRAGRAIAISRLEFRLEPFTALVRALERAGFTEVRYALKKRPYDDDNQ